jgi:hypothetical protein
MQGEGSIVSDVPLKFESLLLVHLAHWKSSKNKSIDKVTAPQIRGVKNWVKQTIEHYKFGSQTPKKLLVCCSVVIGVERLIVELKVALL